MSSTTAQHDPHTYHRTATVNGRRVFYREAGDPRSPTIVLLHGFPSSSLMFRELISTLADQFHLVAPDFIGFGHSEAPSGDEFDYTFENLTAHTRVLLDQLGITSYVFYVHDIGGPVAFRLFKEAPGQVKGFIVQNANTYEEGVAEDAKRALGPLWGHRNEETEKPARQFMSSRYIEYLWKVGARDESRIEPDNWLIDQALMARPGTEAYMLDIVEDLKTNAPLYPAWQAALREHQPKMLILWGNKDPLFIPPGAEGYLRDVPDAKLVWLDAGHFVLDENLRTVAAEKRAAFADGREPGRRGWPPVVPVAPSAAGVVRTASSSGVRSSSPRKATSPALSSRGGVRHGWRISWIARAASPNSPAGSGSV